jgi:beta-mannosidase
MSEYGFQSFPELSTVARYATADQQQIDSPVMRAHQRHPRGNQLIRAYMLRDFRPPRDFASFLYVSQVLQATVIKFGAEAHRRRMPSNAGSLYWQLDDCWPVASWSSIDHFGRWKALHHYARRFFAPVLVSPVMERGAVNIHVVSDRREDLQAHLTLRLIDFDGRELWRKDSDLVLAANTSRVYQTLPRRTVLAQADPARVVLVADLAQGDHLLSRNLLYFARARDQELPAPDLTTSVEVRDGVPVVKVTAGRLARDVRLTVDGADGEFTDNFFDVLPGQTISVAWRATSPATLLTEAAFARALHVVSLRDAF